ncbi:MAG: bifunctional demethylmenaquinone methyltransferase/2-methoxy-6-polyprenyl-1,4-benzoquinol methylase UbiE [Pseudomonadota bacterium]
MTDTKEQPGSTSESDDKTHFGFREIPTGEKERLVGGVFDQVASRYDLMNDLMSGGLHRAWKDAMVAWLAPPRRGDFAHLDVAGGTGDIAFRVIERAGVSAHSTVLDINGEMLAVGQDRAEKQGLASATTFIEGNAEKLPFPDKSFDAYTIAFGIRNVTHIDKALEEAFRVLKTGGRLLCLEFSQVDVPALDKLYDLYSFNAIPTIGRVVTGDGEPYQYLVESIRKFPVPSVFEEMMEDAGFDRVSHRVFSGGIAALHSGWRL